MLNKLICAALLSAGLVASAAYVEDAPEFFIHAGLGAVIFDTKADVELNGSSSAVPNLTGRIDSNYTLMIEGGYMLTPSLSASLTAGLPPLGILEAAGPVGDAAHNPQLGGGFYGPANLPRSNICPSSGRSSPMSAAGWSS